MLKLQNTDKLSIKSLGISLTQESTQKQLERALELSPKLSAYIVEIKTIKKDETETKTVTKKA